MLRGGVKKEKKKGKSATRWCKKRKEKENIGRSGTVSGAVCVGDFCSVPRGGVGKKNRSETDWAVCRGVMLCATRWRKGKMEKSVEDR